MDKRSIAALGIAIAAGLAGCATLNDVTQNQCGNGIIEEPNNEDCDGHPLGADGLVAASGFACSVDCRVICDASGACPDGWGCGTDNVCRRPSGKFATPTINLTENVEHLLLGDLDADGRKDIIVDTGVDLRVHYVDDTGALGETRSINALHAAPAVGDFDGDGITDLSYSLQEAAVTVRLGSTDRSLPAVPFPVPLPSSPDLRVKPGERIIAVNTNAIDSTRFGLRELLRISDNTVTTFFGPSPGAAVATPLLLARVGTGALATPDTVVPVASFDEYSPCEQFVIANTVSNRVEIYRPCRKPDAMGDVRWNDISLADAYPVMLIAPPANVKVAGPVFVLDIDGDAHMDIALYGVDAQGTPQIDVAYGDGQGDFNSTPFLQNTVPDGTAERYLCFSASQIVTKDMALTACANDPPLAIADFNGDRVLDIVNPCGVFITTGSTTDPAVCGHYRNLVPTATAVSGVRGAGWTRAKVVDLNADGRPDVVAASCNDTSITYLENAGTGVFDPSGVFNLHRIPTIGGIDDLEIGDFDGDLVSDVVFSQRIDPLVCTDATTAPSSETLSVVYGSTSGGPSAATDLGDFATIRQIVPGFFTSPTGQYDHVSDITVISTDASTTSADLLHIFEGSTDRAIIAAHYLIDPNNAAPTVPVLVAMGKLDAADTTAGLAVISSERAIAATSVTNARSADLWLLSSQSKDVTGVGYMPLTHVGDPSQYQFSADKGVWMGAINLGGGGADAVVLLTRDGTTSSLYPVLQSAGEWPTTEPSATALSGAYHGPFVVEDLDGDGNKEMLLVSPDDGALVVWNHANGAIDLAGATNVKAELATACSSPPGKFTAATIVRASVGKTRQLLILADNHAYLAGLDPKSPSNHTFKTVQCLDDPLLEAGGVNVAAGDVDGDGVDDVVIARPGSVQLFKGMAVVQ